MKDVLKATYITIAFIVSIPILFLVAMSISWFWAWSIGLIITFFN